MKFSLAIVLLSAVSAHKLVQRDPVVQEAENSFGDTRTAGKQVESV